MKNTYLAILIIMFGTSVAHADLYMELGVEGGSQELIATSSGDNLYSGGGVKFAVGMQNYVSPYTSIRLTLGYLGDSVDAINGSAEMDTLTFDALYLMNSGPHTFGIGPTVHMNPSYRDNVSGYTPVNIEFDDAVGVMFQYGYKLVPGFEVGARVTSIEYRNNTATLDADSIGVYISNGF